MDLFIDGNKLRWEGILNCNCWVHVELRLETLAMGMVAAWTVVAIGLVYEGEEDKEVCTE